MRNLRRQAMAAFLPQQRTRAQRTRGRRLEQMERLATPDELLLLQPSEPPKPAPPQPPNR